jgi:NAD(P)-dependent dehydrogenase (short-subunit alcohol dehydrogenase family)
MNKSLQQLLSLKGKTAVVTGGAGYLGTAISETLAELGANLVLASRDKAKCQKKCEEIVRLTGGSVQAVGLELDVLKKNSATEFFAHVHEHFKAIDILVNNAWSGNKNSWESITDEDWEHDVDMSLNSVFRLTKAAFPDLKTTRGVILNIASMYGHIGPDYRIYDGKEFANPPSYGAAKAGVIQFTRYLASFLSPHGIRVNALSPGAFPHPPPQKHAAACLQESNEPHWPA